MLQGFVCFQNLPVIPDGLYFGPDIYNMNISSVTNNDYQYNKINDQHFMFW